MYAIDYRSSAATHITNIHLMTIASL